MKFYKHIASLLYTITDKGCLSQYLNPIRVKHKSFNTRWKQEIKHEEVQEIVKKMKEANTMLKECTYHQDVKSEHDFGREACSRSLGLMARVRTITSQHQ